jgi:E3 ubiquitin-protein ligase Topors
LLCIFFRENQAQIYRLHDFILRDLTAIRTVERTEGVIRHGLPVNDHNLTTLIMQSVSSYDIRDMYMISSLRPYIGNHSAHFVHELYNYAHSPYDLIGYDRNVRYSIRPIIPTATVYQGLNVSDVFEETPRIISPVPIPPNPRFSETIVLDTDDEEVETNSRLYGQEIIIVSSTNEDSDVEILSHSYLPPRTLDSSRDQPSTSTGIRDSLDRPNNR